MGKWIYAKLKYLFLCLINVLFKEENICYICTKDLDKEFPICNHCLKYLPFLKENTLNYNIKVNKVYSLFRYEGKIKEMIHKLKYKGEYSISSIIGYIMAEFIKNNNMKIDYIVPIPMHVDKLKERGYNHSYLIAKKIGELLSIKVKCCLKKTINTKNQVLLNSNERWYNIKGSIESNFKHKNKNILLIDDVVTTGATAHFSAVALKHNNVFLLSFATSK